MTIRRRPSDPWFDLECRQNQRQVRRLERTVRESNTPEATLNWTTERRAYRNLLQKNVSLFGNKRLMQKSPPHGNFGVPLIH